jgi:U4/U6.U5 tri-snRNP-associated protein 2
MFKRTLMTHSAFAAGATTSSTKVCPYLDTIQRSLLDFDLEATCSVTLESGPHVYACLVCGKFFRGRSSQTPAYIHAVQVSHYLFCHLEKSRFYCLPDGYEVCDPSLQDIREALHPTYTELQIAQLDGNNVPARDLLGRPYVPGFCGLNNPNCTDGLNVIVQALAHVPPLRNYFLRQQELAVPETGVPSAAVQVTRCFGALVRQLWSPSRFKSHVDPHKLINAVAAAASSKYRIGQEQMELGEFLPWFLHQLHLGTGGSGVNRPKKKARAVATSLSKKKSIIEQTFQGKVCVTTRQAKRNSDRSPHQTKNNELEDDRLGSDDDQDTPPVDNPNTAANEPDFCVEELVTETQFLQLTLDLTEKPLFRDEDGGLVIPQEPLVTVLQKLDGVTFTDVVHRGRVQRRKYQLLELPDFLILHLARFKINQYSRVKNPTIVAFPVKNLDLRSYVKPSLPSEEEIRRMNVRSMCCLRSFIFDYVSNSISHTEQPTPRVADKLEYG